MQTWAYPASDRRRSNYWPGPSRRQLRTSRAPWRSSRSPVPLTKVSAELRPQRFTSGFRGYELSPELRRQRGCSAATGRSLAWLRRRLHFSVQESSVHLAWLGESRVLVATIANQRSPQRKPEALVVEAHLRFSRLDLLSPTHTEPEGQLSRAFGRSAAW